MDAAEVPGGPTVARCRGFGHIQAYHSKKRLAHRQIFDPVIAVSPRSSRIRILTWLSEIHSAGPIPPVSCHRAQAGRTNAPPRVTY